MWLGDYPASFTKVTLMFTTHTGSTGAPVAPSTAFEAGDVLLYKDGSATQRSSTSGWTMTSPFDSITGLHCLVIDLSDNTDAGFYAAGHVYTAVLSPDTETVDSQTVAKVLGQFGIDLTGNLKPTTSGRTLDVSAGGEAGVDWANVGSPTTAVDLSGTTIKTTQKVDVDTIKTNPVVNGGTITFPTNATVASTTNITAGTVTTATNVTTVNGLANNVITAASIATNAIDADALAADAVDEIWDEVMEGTTTARQSWRLANSANASKLSGAATTTVAIRDIGDTKDRITATVDANGNRTAVTLDVT